MEYHLVLSPESTVWLDSKSTFSKTHFRDGGAATYKWLEMLLQLLEISDRPLKFSVPSQRVGVQGVDSSGKELSNLCKRKRRFQCKLKRA